MLAVVPVVVVANSSKEVPTRNSRKIDYLNNFFWMLLFVASLFSIEFIL